MAPYCLAALQVALTCPSSHPAWQGWVEYWLGQSWPKHSQSVKVISPPQFSFCRSCWCQESLQVPVIFSDENSCAKIPIEIARNWSSSVTSGLSKCFIWFIYLFFKWEFNFFVVCLFVFDKMRDCFCSSERGGFPGEISPGICKQLDCSSALPACAPWELIVTGWTWQEQS